jgi:hypothetical protein
MKLAPLRRAETPLHKVATQPQRKVANGRVVVKGGIRVVLKHPAYHPAEVVKRVDTSVVSPASSMAKRYLTQRY